MQAGIVPDAAAKIKNGTGTSQYKLKEVIVLKTHSKSIGVSLFLTIALALISATALWASGSGSFYLFCNGNSPNPFGVQLEGGGCCNEVYCSSPSYVSGGIYEWTCNYYADELPDCCSGPAISAGAAVGLTCSTT